MDEFPEDIATTARTPEAEHLFKVAETSDQLSEEQVQLFHMTVAKCLFLCKRARPDIQVAVEY